MANAPRVPRRQTRPTICEDSILQRCEDLQHALTILYEKRKRDYRTVNTPKLKRISVLLEDCAAHPVFANIECFLR
jgi:hypothetical protein